MANKQVLCPVCKRVLTRKNSTLYYCENDKCPVIQVKLFKGEVIKITYDAILSKYMDIQ